MSWPRWPRRRRHEPDEEKLRRLEAAEQETQLVVDRGRAVADELEWRKTRNHLAESFLRARLHRTEGGGRA